MKRRDFIKSTTAVSAAAIASPYILKASRPFDVAPESYYEKIAGDNITIIIELFGGNDGLNTIIPVYNDKYYELRPTLSYPEEHTRRFGTSDVYFNKDIVDDVHNGGMLKLMENGNLAIVEGIGYKDPNLSHFRSEDIILSGVNNSDPKVKLLEGWLAKYFMHKLPDFPEVVPPYPLSMQIGGSLSLLMKGNKAHVGVALNDPDEFFELGQGLTPKEPLMSGVSAYDNEFNFVRTVAHQSEIYSKAVKEAHDKGKDKLKVNYSEGFAQKFKLISSLIAGGLKTKVFFVKLSNFDSHAQQMDSGFGGQHPTLLRELANAVSEFMDDAYKQGFADRVAGCTISEFGRRAYDNGSRGCDHGAASMQFVFGGEYVESGYFGSKPDLDNLDKGGNVVFQHDFRRVYADFLYKWMGAEVADVKAVFGEDFMPVGVLKPRYSSVDDGVIKNLGADTLNVYPNPSFGNSKVRFELKKSGNIELAVYDIQGQLQQKVHSGYLRADIYNLDVNINKSGTYIVSLVSNNIRFTTNLTVVR